MRKDAKMEENESARLMIFLSLPTRPVFPEFRSTWE
jgi:hypothetical protein